MQKIESKQKGFTLVELLVVIAILAILATISLVVYTNAVKNARDARRKAEIISLAKNIESYKIDHGNYPDSLEDLKTGQNTLIATDPLNDATHYYSYQKYNAGEYGCTHKFYVLGVTKFENSPKLSAWKCPQYDFSNDFDWALGGYE